MKKLFIWFMIGCSIISPFYFLSLTYYNSYDYMHINFTNSKLELPEIKNEIHELTQIIKITNKRKAAIKYINGLIENITPDSLRIKIAESIYEATIRYDNLNINYICALIKQESYWGIYTTSYKGARGLMQVMPSTGIALAKILNIKWNGHETLFDPVLNIKMGTYYLYKLVNNYGEIGALVAYNSGYKGHQYWIKTGSMYSETKIYVSRIMSFYKQYKEINL